jgi:large subunit ribosomal protein L23
MTHFNPYSVIVRPILTERSTTLKEKQNQYIFEVLPEATKPDIRHAVEEIFKVKVLSVRTMNVLGKFRRLGRSMGKKPDWKKAIVTLGEGQKIDLVEQS